MKLTPAEIGEQMEVEASFNERRERMLTAQLQDGYRQFNEAMTVISKIENDLLAIKHMVYNAEAGIDAILADIAEFNKHGRAQ